MNNHQSWVWKPSTALFSVTLFLGLMVSLVFAKLSDRRNADNRFNRIGNEEAVSTGITVTLYLS
jgi:hypothetical protein